MGRRWGDGDLRAATASPFSNRPEGGVMSKGLKAASALGAIVGAGWFVHRFGHRSGVSREEARQQLPGDEVVGHPQCRPRAQRRGDHR